MAREVDDRPAEPMRTPRTALLLAYPGFTALDLFGPQYFLTAVPGLAPRAVARGRAPVPGDGGAMVVPACTFATAPEECEVLLVPGSSIGLVAAMRDGETLAFLRARAAKARIVASVSAGSLVLGAAGLLRATSHRLVRNAVLGAVLSSLEPSSAAPVSAARRRSACPRRRAG